MRFARAPTKGGHSRPVSLATRPGRPRPVATPRPVV